MKKIVTLKITLIVLFALVMGVYAMPSSWKEKIPAQSVKNYLLKQHISLGLDLAGGSQLDFKINLERLQEQNKTDTEINAIVDKVAAKLAKRADPSGTKELNVQTSTFGDEKHVLVEITADLDTEETRENLQKIVDLEFKEQNTETSDEDKAKIQSEAQASLDEIKNGADFQTVFDREKAKSYVMANEHSYFYDQLDKNNADLIWKSDSGTVIDHLMELDEGYTIVNNGLVPLKGYSILKIKEKKMEDRENTTPGEDFDTVREDVSDGSSQEILMTDIDPSISGEVMNLAAGQISGVLETADAYHIYKVLPAEDGTDVAKVKEIVVNKGSETAEEKIKDALARLQDKTSTTQEEKIYYDEIFYQLTATNPWKTTGLDGQYFKTAKVSQDPNTGISVVEIQFDDEGKQLFADITERNVGKPVAIFVDGELISAPTVNEKIEGGSAVITSGVKNYMEAKKWAINLKNELETGAIDAAPVLVGETRVKASLGADSLNASVKAGVIGLIVLAIWMILAYRLSGLLAILALGVYTTAIFFLISVNIAAWGALLIALVVGVTAFISFGSFEKNEFLSITISLFMMIFTYVVLRSNIVLTLAGVAGIVLSIGMAVDANILIFERMKEELKDGKNFSAALSLGFERAWSSIRDSNISSLITCLILYFFGTSIIKGFAVTLALGIVVSMFTAITVSRTFLSAFVGTKISRKPKIFANVK